MATSRMLSSIAAAALCCQAAFAATAGTPAQVPQSLVTAHMQFLASDALHGRGSGTRDEWLAATYIAAQFTRLGLRALGDSGSFVQSIEIARTEVLGAPTLKVGSLSYTHGVDMLVRGLEKGQVSGVLQKFHQGKSPRSDAFVLLPEDADRSVRDAAGKAAAVLIAETDRMRAHWQDIARAPLTAGSDRIVGLKNSADGAEQQLQIVLSLAAYKALAALPEGTAVSFSAQTHATRVHTWNAVAALPGTDSRMSGQAILLSAHLDHLGVAQDGADRIYNGADDDASGTTAVLALAEALAHGPAPKRTVLFALFGSEEAGGHGARWFVERPPVPLSHIIANLEFEMIGRPDAKVAKKSLWLTGWERSNLGPELAKRGARLVADPHPEENFFMRSDNITLARRGVVAQTVSSFGLHGQYHQPDDDLAHIDFAHMTEAIESMVEPVRWLADSAFTPEWRAAGRP